MQLKNIVILLSIALILCVNACVSFENEYTVLPPGTWRAYLRLDPPVQQLDQQGKPLADPNNLSFKEVTAGELPFTMEVTYTDDSTFYIEIINGAERIKVDHITYGRDRATLDDTIVIDFPDFDTYIKGVFKEGIIEGKWYVNYKEDYSIPFIAKYGKGYRFTELTKAPMMDVSGSWSTVFGEGDNRYNGIGEFEQDGNKLTGTFRTETGDYRYLDGTIQENKIYLSTFDGSHAFLFEGRIQPDSSIQGIFRSGKHWQTVWEAKKDQSVELADLNTMTYMVDQQSTFNVDMLDKDGQQINLDHPSFKGKKKIVQLMGTWCPNCKDETLFLKEYLEHNPSENLSVFGLAFEYYEPEKSLEIIKRYRQTLDVPYPIYYGGNSKKAEASKKLAMLNKLIAYPTMIFLDEQNNVQKIHTGFNGPATSEYESFQTEFHSFMKTFLKTNQ